MNTDLRRSKRFSDFIPVKVTTNNKTTGTRRTEPYEGRVVNISRHGACLLLSLKTPESCEIYRSTSNVTRISLELERTSSKINKKMTVTGHPVWMDPFILDDLQALKMGIEFYPDTFSHQLKNFPEDLVPEPTDTALVFPANK